MNGGPAIMFASSARSPDGTIVGGWSVDASVTAAGCPGVRSSHKFISFASR